MTWYYLALISACLVAIYEIIQKKVLLREHSFDLIATSTLLGFLFSVPLINSPEFHTVDNSMLLLIFIKCVFATSALVFGARSLRHMDISEYAPLMNLSPLFLLIMSFFFLGETLSFMNLSGFFLIIFGAYFLELKDGGMSPFKKMYQDKYMHFIILAMIFVSLTSVMDRFILSKGISVETYFVYNKGIIALLCFLISSFLFNGYKDIVKVIGRSLIPIIVMTIVSMAADIVFFVAVAIPIAKITLVISLRRMSTLIATIVGGEFFKEKQILQKSIACLIMLAGVFFIIQA